MSEDTKGIKRKGLRVVRLRRFNIMEFIRGVPLDANQFAGTWFSDADLAAHDERVADEALEKVAALADKVEGNFSAAIRAMMTGKG